MEVSQINAFVQASTNVLKTFTGETFKLGSLYVKDSPYDADSFVVLVGITGGLQGTVTLGFSTDIALKLASAMMMGRPIDVIGDMEISALQELGNMIMGNSATALHGLGVIIDITPPTLIKGVNVVFSTDSMRTIGLPLISPTWGEVHFNISVKEEKTK